jgi:hypothetical protein
LEQKHRAKTVRRWLGAACVLAVACVCLLPGRAVAHTDASSKTSPGNKTGGTKAPTPKNHAKAAASGSSASSSSAAKAHPVSHPAANKHPKSNAAITARSSKSTHAISRKNSKRRTTARGQQKIEPERAQAIQEALIREHYMSGEPMGTWNQDSEDAMRRYQADHGWQSKTVPDSRALISLGLGPSHDHLLNPESAMTTGPEVSHAASVASSSQNPVSHSAEPGARISTAPMPSADPAPGTSSDHDASGPQ